MESAKILIKRERIKFSIIIAIIVIVSVLGYAILPGIFCNSYTAENIVSIKNSDIKKDNFHIKTPESVKAVYLTSWGAGSEKVRRPIVNMIEKTELNSLVTDIKDFSGTIFFDTKNPAIIKYAKIDKNRVPDLRDFIKELHSKNIYVIGRIAVFQNEYLAEKRLDLAVKTKTGKVWNDRKGLSWVEPSSKEIWDYTIALAKEAYNIGFDEINFDYIRFPSDGNMDDVKYELNGLKEKTDVMEEFFKYLSSNLTGTGIKTSADLFGMTTTVKNDMLIGQIFERVIPYFDYISPMVYPHHYPVNYLGIKNPNMEPYKLVNLSLLGALNRASTSPWKIRPWLQDFDIGVIYGPKMVGQEISATYDSGFNSWMLWDPSCKYAEGALNRE